MTVLIGLRCVDGGILACDSQETRVNYFRYWPKARLVADKFVVLYAGNPTIGEAFTRHLEKLIREAKDKENKISQSRAVELVEEVLLSLAKEAGEDAVKGRQILIAGVSDMREICIWAVDSDELYLREMRTWECYGSGIDAAEMLMKDFYFPEITIQQAIPLLAYVIQAVSEICIDCGGPINIVTINDQGIKQLETVEVKTELDRISPLLNRLRKELPRQAIKREKLCSVD